MRCVYVAPELEFPLLSLASEAVGFASRREASLSGGAAAMDCAAMMLSPGRQRRESDGFNYNHASSPSL